MVSYQPGTPLGDQTSEFPTELPTYPPPPAGTAPAQSLGAEHSQPFHAYIMGIPGLKVCTAASPAAAYGPPPSLFVDFAGVDSGLLRC